MPARENAGVIDGEVNTLQHQGRRKGVRGAFEKAPSRGRRADNCIMLCTDRFGKITRMNAYGDAFFGKAVGGDVERKFSDIALPENYSFDRRKKRFIDNFLSTPVQNDFAEFETRCALGGPRRVAWNRSAVFGSDGRIDEMLYVGIEVQSDGSEEDDVLLSCAAGAELNYFETRPCHSESNYSLLEKYIANSKVWAWEIGPDGRFCYVSPGVEKLIGYSPGELITKTMDFLLQSISENGFIKVLEGAIQTEPRHFQLENLCRRKDGQWVWTEISGVVFCDENGAFSGARGMNRDIALEVGVKEELALREQEYRYLFDNTQVALIMTRADGVIMNINRTGAKMHEKAPEDMIGLKFMEFLPEKERENAFKAFKESYQRAKAQKTNFVDIEPHVVRVDTPRGTRHLRIVPKAIKVMEGDQMVAMLNTALDITESHMLQKALERHQIKLQQLVDERTQKIRALQDEMLRSERLTALGRLTSTVSHEIRNPLGTISSSLYIINERLKGWDYGVAPAIERGSRAIRRCDGIIEEMLDFTRTKGLEKRMVDISSWLDKILDEMTFQKNVSVVKRIEAGLSAPIDAGRFHRCVRNIVENAQEALSGVNGGSIQIDARLADDRLEILVTDTGPGVSKAHRERVFDPLFSTKRNGIGMGLPVCKQVMQLHGGSIDITSESGRGTTVILRLPAASQGGGR